MALVLNHTGSAGLSAVGFRRLQLESLILAQNQRWRRASYMQVERESGLRAAGRVADG